MSDDVPCGLVGEMWTQEIVPLLVHQGWALLTPVRIRRTCRWFARNIVAENGPGVYWFMREMRVWWAERPATPPPYRLAIRADVDLWALCPWCSRCGTDCGHQR
jgi:hypothetical protein